MLRGLLARLLARRTSASNGADLCDFHADLSLDFGAADTRFCEYLDNLIAKYRGDDEHDDGDNRRGDGFKLVFECREDGR